MREPNLSVDTESGEVFDTTPEYKTVVRRPVVSAEMISIAELQVRRQEIDRAVQEIMKLDIHYGKVPGTTELTLYKEGAEVLLSTFQLRYDLDIERDDWDGEIVYQVTARCYHMATGMKVGEGLGVCSSLEDKWAWRQCSDVEWDNTDTRRRRIKYKDQWHDGRPTGRVTETKQVRQEPANVINTVLKMAKKRAVVDVAVAVLNVGDLFKSLSSGDHQTGGFRPRQQSSAVPQQNGMATDKQIKMIAARLRDKTNGSLERLLAEYSIPGLESLPIGKVNEVLAWINKI